MRLKQHIAESRGTIIDELTAITSIKKQCSSALNALKKEKIIYRGVGDESVGHGDFIFIKPSSSQRVSANTHNLYTLVIDESHNWGKYPDRSKSIICTTDYDNSNNYGRRFVVLPKNGYTFGVCPRGDLWESFEDTLHMKLDDFNMDVLSLISEMDMNYNIYKQLKTPADLKSLLKQMDKAFDESDISENRFDWLSEYNGSFLELFEYLLDPQINGFTISKDINNIPSFDREVWTDTDSYLVSFDWLTKNKKKLI
jgi:hypothetical protein